MYTAENRKVFIKPQNQKNLNENFNKFLSQTKRLRLRTATEFCMGLNVVTKFSLCEFEAILGPACRSKQSMI